ncbi:microtubule-associated serine/threonine-protein kinase 2-like [Spea bombifrons]|uniref:microtubule-associated serine/threonine-protein kinase 2-like n=1 Tax=Spea bombifrons TaxID=233779 RepID=UPI002349C154|nr:microtubule-associated serine/threonine-protein kinase 2-like [Spea bombifrons]
MTDRQQKPIIVKLKLNCTIAPPLVCTSIEIRGEGYRHGVGLCAGSRLKANLNLTGNHEETAGKPRETRNGDEARAAQSFRRRTAGPEDRAGGKEQDTVPPPAPLIFRKLSNPDLFSSTGKVKLHRQLSQDDCKLRRGSLASSLTGKQLLPLSNSVHSGVSQLTWQPPAESSNLVRMRNQCLGQSAPSLTASFIRRRRRKRNEMFLSARPRITKTDRIVMMVKRRSISLEAISFRTSAGFSPK